MVEMKSEREINDKIMQIADHLHEIEESPQMTGTYKTGNAMVTNYDIDKALVQEKINLLYWVLDNPSTCKCCGAVLNAVERRTTKVGNWI